MTGLIGRGGHVHGGVLLALLGMTGFSARGCEPPAQLTAVECPPLQRDATGFVSLQPLAGRYTVTLITTEGSSAGRSVTGALVMEAYGPGTGRPRGIPADPAVQYPVHGSLTGIVLDSIGAAAPGPIDSADPDRPGVLGLEWEITSGQASQRQSLLRLGAEANAGGPARFDGGYLTLTPMRADPQSFTGRWASGGGRISAGGYFCAARLPLS